MAKIPFLTQFTMPAYAGADYSDIPSQATPDEAFTLRDMITQFASGVREFEEIVGGYDEQPDWDVVSPLNNPKFDLVDATIAEVQLAEQHLVAVRQQKEREAHLQLLQEEEAARHDAIKRAEFEKLDKS